MRKPDPYQAERRNAINACATLTQALASPERFKPKDWEAIRNGLMWVSLATLEMLGRDESERFIGALADGLLTSGCSRGAMLASVSGSDPDDPDIGIITWVEGSDR